MVTITLWNHLISQNPLVTSGGTWSAGATNPPLQGTAWNTASITITAEGTYGPYTYTVIDGCTGNSLSSTLHLIARASVEIENVVPTTCTICADATSNLITSNSALTFYVGRTSNVSINTLVPAFDVTFSLADSNSPFTTWHSAGFVSLLSSQHNPQSTIALSPLQFQGLNVNTVFNSTASSGTGYLRYGESGLNGFCMAGWLQPVNWYKVGILSSSTENRSSVFSNNSSYINNLGTPSVHWGTYANLTGITSFTGTVKLTGFTPTPNLTYKIAGTNINLPSNNPCLSNAISIANYPGSAIAVANGTNNIDLLSTAPNIYNLFSDGVSTLAGTYTIDYNSTFIPECNGSSYNRVIFNHNSCLLKRRTITNATPTVGTGIQSIVYFTNVVDNFTYVNDIKAKFPPGIVWSNVHTILATNVTDPYIIESTKTISSFSVNNLRLRNGQNQWVSIPAANKVVADFVPDLPSTYMGYCGMGQYVLDLQRTSDSKVLYILIYKTDTNFITSQLLNITGCEYEPIVQFSNGENAPNDKQTFTVSGITGLGPQAY